MNMITRPPSVTRAKLNEAITALQRGLLGTALSIARAAAQNAPYEVDAWWVLSMAAYRMWLLDEAEAALAAGAELLARDPARRGDFTSRRATLLIQLGRNAEAIQLARSTAYAGGAKAAHLSLYGNVLLSAGHAETAIKVLSRAIERDPSLADSWFRLGRAQEALGHMDTAESAYEKAILAGSHTGAHLALARLNRWTHARNHIDRLQAAPTRDSGDVSRIQNALFKVYDDLGMCDEAWQALETSNQAALDEILPSPNGIWGTEHEAVPLRLRDMTLAKETSNVAAWKRYLPRERFAGRTRPSPAGKTPRRIFIIGLPRSGTTLVERILAAHSQVQALGEIRAFPIAVKRLSGIRGGGLLNPDIIAHAAGADPQAFADAYNRETAAFDNGKAYTVDKLTQNYEYAGLIRLAFPDAIIIQALRDPMDTLFSAYKLLMGSDHLWTYRLKDLAEHYGNYVSLMAHWRDCVGDMMEVSLEALIANPEDQIRALVSACGLPFEEACLAPHTAGGAVITSSSVQVRAPINAQGVGAWRRYERQLAPLQQQLRDMGLI